MGFGTFSWHIKMKSRVVAGLSSSAVSVVDDEVSPPPWGNAIPSLLPLLANIASRGASSTVGRTVRFDLSLLLYLTGYTGYSLWLQKKRYINIARKHRNRPNNRKKDSGYSGYSGYKGFFPKASIFPGVGRSVTETM